MASDNDTGSWDRVAAELRACRESQQRTWGDIDNTTLGRYLADEVSGAERRRVEEALDELPELRKLTDLVRDVLNEFEPAAVPESVAAPAVVSFPARTARRPFWAGWRQRSALAAAACLLLTLGLYLVRDLGPAQPRGGEFAVLNPLPPSVAQRDTRTGVPEGNGPLMVRAAPAAHPEELQLAMLDKKVDSLEKVGRVREAKTLAVDRADKANGLAEQLEVQGELVRAESLLTSNHGYCKRKLGDDHPQTVRTRTNLATVYQAAVNTTDANAGSAYAYQGVAALPSILPPSPVSLSPFPHAGHHMDKKAEGSARALHERITTQSPRQLRQSVVPVLTEALRKASSPAERETLARALGRLGPAASGAVTVLTDTLEKATEPRERQAILLALGQMGPAAAQKAGPVLVTALKSTCEESRQGAAEALVRWGPSARGYFKQLSLQAESKDALACDVLRRLQGREGRIGVNDESECFSVKILNDSQRAIRDVARLFDVELLVETVPSLPVSADKKSDDRARELGVQGVYLLLARDTPAVSVHVSDRMSKQGFSADHLRQTLEPKVQKGNFDLALVAAVEEVIRFEQSLRVKKAP